MPQTTSTIKHRFESGEEVDVDIRWSFLGSAVHWFGNVRRQAEAVARIGGRIQLSAGTESSAPSVVLVEVRRELWRRSAELEGRLAWRHTETGEAPSIESIAAVDVELELASGTARGDLLWREFFGESATSVADPIADTTREGLET